MRSLRKILILLMVAVAAAAAFTVTAYEPLLKKGRVWKGFFGQYYGVIALEKPTTTHRDPPPIDSRFETTIDRDTVINGIEMAVLVRKWGPGQHRMYDREDTMPFTETLFAYERDGIVYNYKEGQHFKLMDFNLTEGDSVPRWFTNYSVDPDTSYYRNKGIVSLDDSITIRGNRYRRLWIQASMLPEFWIEGIGWIVDAHTDFYGPMSGVQKKEYIDSVFDGDRCIFTITDAFQGTPLNAAVGSITAEELPDMPSLVKYDLHGRRILNPAKGSLYIQGGKLHVAQ